MQSFMLSSKSAQFLEYMDLRTRTVLWTAKLNVGPMSDTLRCQ